MKKSILAGSAAGLLAGGFFAFRWFRGESAYEKAVQNLQQESALDAAMPMAAAPA